MHVHRSQFNRCVQGQEVVSFETATPMSLLFHAFSRYALLRSKSLPIVQGQEVIFFETATQLGSARSHAAVECVPVPPKGE